MGKRPKICLSLNCKDLKEVKAELEEFMPYADMVELCSDKLDKIEEMGKDEYISLLKIVKESTEKRELIVDFKGEDELQNRVLRWSIGIANYIDIDYGNPIGDELIKEAKTNNTKVIMSFHNFDRMLSSEEVKEQYENMGKSDADILKIACYANKNEDMYEVLNGALNYSSQEGAKDIIAIAMGKEGEESRICMGDFGSVISYACGSKETAPGQFNAKKISEYINKYYENN